MVIDSGERKEKSSSRNKHVADTPSRLKCHGTDWCSVCQEIACGAATGELATVLDGTWRHTQNRAGVLPARSMVLLSVVSF
jgi:hypothetical protein